MATATQPLIEELYSESRVTRRMLERVPEDKLTWRPHPKSMTLGQLALHTAQVPGNLSGLLAMDRFDAADANFEPAQPNSRAEILAALDGGLARAESFMAGLEDEAVEAAWTLSRRGAELATQSRGKWIRAL